MNQINHPPKPSQYHFCVRITPKTLSMSIFQSKGIESLYKLQIDKGTNFMYQGSKKQTYQVMRRNLHQQALDGFYKSQKCYFTLNNYTNLRPYEMKVIFSEISNSTGQQQVIFVYKFSTFGIVKNFLQNGVRRSTHVVTVDYQTQFYIDLYIQSNKIKLQQKVNLDGNMQTLRKRYVQDSEQQSETILDKIGMNDSFYEKYSDANRNSIHSNYSPSKSSHRNSQSLHRINSQNQSFTGTRYSIPNTDKGSNQSRPKRRNLISNDVMQDSRSQKISHSKSKNHSSSHKNLHGKLKVNQSMFLKKSPSTQLSIGEFRQQNRTQKKQQDKNSSLTFSHRPSFQMSQQFSVFTNEVLQTSTNRGSQLFKNDQNQTYLQLIYNVKNMSAEEIRYRFKKNFVFLLVIFVIIFMVLSKAFDLGNLQGGKNTVRKSTKTVDKNKKYYKEKQILKNDEQKMSKIDRVKKQSSKKETNKKVQKQKLHKSKKFKGDLKQF